MQLCIARMSVCTCRGWQDGCWALLGQGFGGLGRLSAASAETCYVHANRPRAFTIPLPASAGTDPAALAGMLCFRRG